LAGILQAANGLLQEYNAKAELDAANVNESWAALRGSLLNSVLSG